VGRRPEQRRTCGRRARIADIQPDRRAGAAALATQHHHRARARRPRGCVLRGHRNDPHADDPHRPEQARQPDRLRQPRLPRPHRLHRGGGRRAQLPLPPGRADQSRTRGQVAPSGRREAGCLGRDPELQARRLPVLERRVHRAGVRPRRRAALLLRQPTRHHPPALLGAGLPAGAEDGVHRPAHRGLGARFQQPAPRRRRQPRTPECPSGIMLFSGI
ncbi:MAG: Sensor histidine kinase, partial [uncultured Nocardioidaceae bacterium]